MLVFGVYHYGSLIRYVVARDAKEAIAIVNKDNKFSGVITAVKQRSIPFDDLSKDSLCNYLDINLRVDVDWGRLTKADLMSIAASVADLQDRLWETQKRLEQALSPFSEPLIRERDHL